MTHSTSNQPRIFACSLALLLAACGGDDNKGTTADSADTTEGASASDPATTGGDTDPTTTDDAPTTAGVSDTNDDTTTNAVDPCDACDANASCDGDRCVCDDGFDGDGETCTDIDECAGKNDCSVDASCSNTPGDYDCTCNDGYKGDGEDCKDIDECNEDLDNCSINADCTNQDGGFKCECKDGFNGDGIVCNGSKEFGETCKEAQDCSSGLCLLGDFKMCTISCTQQVADDCGDQGAAGLCVPVGNDQFVCAGDLTFGNDKDAEILQPGDSLMRTFQTVTDADLFLIDTPGAGTLQVAAFPDLDDTLQIDFYNGDGTVLGTVKSAGVGEPAAGDVMNEGAGIFFAVVRNIGNSNGSYKIQVVKI